MFRKSAIIFLSVFFMAAWLYAQSADVAEVSEITKKYDYGLTKQPGVSLLDLSRISFSHSYSLSYFSGGGISGTTGLYTGSIIYQLANPLTLTLNVGILHDPSSLWGDNKITESAVFLPSGYLDWRPSDNFHMSIGFQSIPAGWYYPGYYNYGRYPYYSR